MEKRWISKIKTALIVRKEADKLSIELFWIKATSQCYRSRPNRRRLLGVMSRSSEPIHSIYLIYLLSRFYPILRPNNCSQTFTEHQRSTEEFTTDWLRTFNWKLLSFIYHPSFSVSAVPRMQSSSSYVYYVSLAVGQFNASSLHWLSRDSQPEWQDRQQRP